MAPTDWIEEEEAVYWTNGTNSGWTGTASEEQKVVVIRDPALAQSNARLSIRNNQLSEKVLELQVEVNELKIFKKKVAILEKILKEIESNTSKVKIARLIRNINVR